MGCFSPPKRTPPLGHCVACSHFRNDPVYLETVFKGLISFSSAYASVRADDGLCTRHDRYLSAQSFCGDFSAVS
jgi:hypothetical protein